MLSPTFAIPSAAMNVNNSRIFHFLLNVPLRAAVWIILPFFIRNMSLLLLVLPTMEIKMFFGRQLGSEIINIFLKRQEERKPPSTTIDCHRHQIYIACCLEMALCCSFVCRSLLSELITEKERAKKKALWQMTLMSTSRIFKFIAANLTLRLMKSSASRFRM